MEIILKILTEQAQLWRYLSLQDSAHMIQTSKLFEQLSQQPAWIKWRQTAQWFKEQLPTAYAALNQHYNPDWETALTAFEQYLHLPDTEFHFKPRFMGWGYTTDYWVSTIASLYDWLSPNALPQWLLKIIRNPYPDHVMFLLAYEASQEAVRKQDTLETAIKQKNYEAAFQYLVKGTKPEHIDLAIKNNYIEIVKLLIARGATVDPHHLINPTLHNQLELLKLLLEHTQPDENTLHGILNSVYSPHQDTLNYLAQSIVHRKININMSLHDSVEHLVFVKLLVAASADVNAQDKHGKTPLHRAIESDRYDTAEYLIHAGANLTIEDNEGLSAWHMVILRNLADFIPLFKSIINETFPNSKAAIHIAAEKNSIEFVKRLITEGADINAIDLAGWTALHLAATQKNVKLIQCLLEAKANPLALDRNGWTPLHRSAQQNHTEGALVLMAHSEKALFIKNDDGNTPCDIANKAGFHQLANSMIIQSPKAPILLQWKQSSSKSQTGVPQLCKRRNSI